MIIDELITILGLKTDPKAPGEAKAFSKTLDVVTNSAKILGGALVAVAGGVAAYTVKQSQAIDAGGKFADSVGITYENLQALEYAIESAGGSVGDLRSDLEGLTKSMSSPVPGEYNQTLHMLGIASRDAAGNLRSADEVLYDIAGKLEGMSNIQQQQFASKLGISQGTLKLIQQGQAGIDGLRNEAFRLGLVMDETSKEKAARFQGSLSNSRAVVDALTKTIAIGLMPSMADSLDMFTEWIVANRDFIATGVQQVVEGVAKGFDLAGDAVSWLWAQVEGLVGPVGEMVSGLDATQAIAVAVALALGAVAVSVLAATWPVIAIAAAIAAVVVVFEDLYAAIQGQDSVIGGWVDSFKASYPAISGVLESILGILGRIASFVTDVLVASFGAAASAISAVFGGLVDTLVDVLGAVESILSGADPFEVIGDLFSKQVDRVLGLASGLASGVAGLFDSVFGTNFAASMTTEGSDSGSPATGSVGEAPEVVLPATAPVPASVIQSSSSSSNVVNNITNNINGAGNPSAVAQEIGNRGGFGQTLQQSSPGFNGPVVG